MYKKIKFRVFLFSFLFTFLFFFILLKCNGWAQSHNYGFTWDPNIEPDISYYEIRAWDGPDTLTGMADFSNNWYTIGFYSHDSLLVLYPSGQLRAEKVLTQIENGEYIIGAIKAIDLDGNESGWSFSPPFKKPDYLPPQKVAGFGVYRE